MRMIYERDVVQVLTVIGKPTGIVTNKYLVEGSESEFFYWVRLSDGVLLKDITNNEIILVESIKSVLTQQHAVNGDLVSNCCASYFDAFGYEKEEGIWQEKCLHCGKLCEPIYMNERDIKSIKQCNEWNK